MKKATWATPSQFNARNSWRECSTRSGERGHDFPQDSHAVMAPDGMVLVHRDQFALGRKATQIMNVAHRAFLEDGIVAVPAMFCDIAPQLLLRMRVQYFEVEVRYVGSIGHSRSLQNDRQAQCLDHLRNLPYIVHFELPRARHAQSPGEFEIAPLIKHVADRLGIGHGQPGVAFQAGTPTVEEHQGLVTGRDRQGYFVPLDNLQEKLA